MKKLMITVTLSGIIFARNILGQEDIQEIITQAEKASQSAAKNVKAWLRTLSRSNKVCHSKEEKTEALGQCGVKHPIPKGTHISHAQLLIFVSASMPQSSIKALGEAAQKIGARVVFRGLIGGMFQQTQSYMKDLGIVAEIDPTKFEDHQVTEVPTFILVHNKNLDRITGHISLWEALDQFRKKGELKADAKKLYQLLEQNFPYGGRS